MGSFSLYELSFAYFCGTKNLSMILLQYWMSANETNSATNYLPIALQLLFAGGFVAMIILISSWMGPKRDTSDKLENFASGIGTHGDARSPMAIKYFLVAILFVLFDVEVIFFYPYAVNFKTLGWAGFMEVILFVGFFLVGFIYIIKKGALQWED
jgi:NADH-quinone oxidoreductase subunit A